MTYSVIIPTYNKCDQLLKPCLDSLLQYTDINSDLSKLEIIVVANGCTDNTREYVTSLQSRFHNILLVWSDEALGYTKATNLGIKEAAGDYIILLNNDTVFLPQYLNEWLEILRHPFNVSDRVGLTGPMMVESPSAGNRRFIIFFCIMIARKVFNKIGYLDEVFSPGYGEDTDFCLKAEGAGFLQVQVPIQTTEYYADKRMTGNFPIYHAGNETFKDYPDASLIHRNNDILAERYCKIDISKAIQCDGYMANEELEWLAKQATKHSTIIEVGSWHGKSSRAIADNMHANSTLYCVDHWRGSEVERDNNHISANWDSGDHAYLEYCDNMFDHIQSGKVQPVRLSSKNAANLLHKKGIKADMIFIDAGHTYEEVKEDILHWLPVLKEGGTICGHDCFHVNNVWPGVGQAVFELFGSQVKQAPNTSIWVVDTPQLEKREPAIFDCFPFNNELDILDTRLQELFNVVDRFVIVEARHTHSGRPKELNFHNNLNRYSSYLSKITYLVIEEFPPFEGSVTDKSWARERYQRDFIMNGLKGCQQNDIVIISDCDEIPNKKTIQNIRDKGINGKHFTLEMDLYYYNKTVKAVDKWREAKVTDYRTLTTLGPCGLRYAPDYVVIADAGQHRSYFGGVTSIIEKIENTAHQEYNTPEMKDPKRIAKAISEGIDIFGRENVKFEKIC